jgi:hypothetical protein
MDGPLLAVGQGLVADKDDIPFLQVALGIAGEITSTISSPGLMKWVLNKNPLIEGVSHLPKCPEDSGVFLKYCFHENSPLQVL